MHRLLYLIFFVSGAAALIFETLWFNLAGLALGNSVWASSLVLASFMGGLALGNGLAGRWGHRLADPIRAYARLEILIAVAGLGLVLLFPVLNQLLAPLFRPFLDRPLILNPIRLSISFLLLLAPAAAMGATLPLMVKGLGARATGFGRTLGLLYGLNTLGAVAGVMLAETVLIGRVGLRGSGFVAAGCDLVAAAAAILVARHMPVRTGKKPAPDRAAPPPFAAHGKRLLAAAFLSGGILLALEVVWFRYLLLFMFGTSLQFAVMLAVVLAGIGLGGMIASRWLAQAAADRALPPLALGAGVLVVAGYALSTSDSLGFSIGHSHDVWVNLRPALGLMFPVSLVSGVLFTLTGQALHRGMRDAASETRAAGYLTLANTTGAMLGALLGGFVLLPELGMERSLFALALAYGVVALLTYPFKAEQAPRPVSLRILAPAAMVFAVVAALFPFAQIGQKIFPAIVGAFPGTRLVEAREGVLETVLYLRRDRFGLPHHYRMMTNGLSMSGTTWFARRYMKFYVYLPVALHPGLHKALLISYGVGSTAKALTDTKQLEQIDVVDISRDILEMGSIVYSDPADHPLNDPRVRVHVDDGRFFLQVSEEQYDLITAEPPPPKAAGITALYSKEYFRLLHDRLAAGGMATYWLPMSQLSQTDFRAIARGFCEVFEECSLWTGAGTDWMLLGRRAGGVRVDAARFAAQWRDPEVLAELKALGFEEPGQIGALFLADGPQLRALCADTPPLVDDFPQRLSPDQQLRMESSYEELMAIEPSRERFERSEQIAALFPESVRRQSLPYFAYRHILNNVLSPAFPSGPRRDDLDALEEVLAATSLETLPLWLLGSNAREQQIVEALSPAKRENASVDEALGDRALAQRDLAAAAAHYRRGFERDPKKLGLAFLELLALTIGELEDEAARAASALDEIMPREQWRAHYRNFLAQKFGVTNPGAARDAEP